MNESDVPRHAQLLTRARDGDTAAFGELVSAHQQRVLRLATAISGDPAEAYDIVQEAFIRTFRSLEALRSPAAFGAWLTRAVANEAKNSVRGAARRERRHLRDASSTTRVIPGVDEQALTAISRDGLLGALRSLDPGDREVLGCRYLAELSEAETADVLGVAIGTVKSRTWRALARLRTAMDAPVVGEEQP